MEPKPNAVSQNPDISIIICTRNHASALEPTLQSLAQAKVPAGRSCELVVVDNGSSDNTAQIVENAKIPNIEVRLVREERPGLSNARNCGLAASRGAVILFTDDDIRPPSDWIERMSAPILSGKFQAVAGGVRLAPHLESEEMEPMHRQWLASTQYLKPEELDRMVGANMAFGREVLERVAAFDAELGAGALGFGEESLFSRQILEAGFKLEIALDVCVEHHFDASRLARVHLIDAAQRRGRVSAYTKHHWEHTQINHPHYGLARAVLRLMWWRFLRRKQLQKATIAPVWELSMIWEISLYRAWLTERRRPRKYQKRGLGKLDSPASDSSPDGSPDGA